MKTSGFLYEKVVWQLGAHQLFNVDTQSIVNTVNCTGVMGAGIALEFMLRYPDMFKDYEIKCKDKRIVT